MRKYFDWRKILLENPVRGNGDCEAKSSSVASQFLAAP
jgi:hypothetical protein